MAVSGNGWPVSPIQSDLGIESFIVGGAAFPVRGGRVREVLEYVITQVHNRVEKVNAAYGNWGYSYRMNVNSPGSWSNHASGTAVDFNATRHPNGVPTAATFSAAQIAEIHKILAEVGNVVRWGGDYNGTPDAMHFEINVSPDALDVEIDTNAIPESGEIKPIGAPTLADPTKIPRLTENSVSYPTMMNYGHGYAQWRFTPQETGTISIDALLSHFADPAIEADNPLGPKLNLYIFEIAYDSEGGIIPRYGTEVMASPWPGDDTHPARQTGQMSVSVVAGKDYIIRATCTPSFPWIRAVIRIGDYARVSDWIQPPLVKGIVTVNSRRFNNNESLYFPQDFESASGDDWIYAQGEPGWLYGGFQSGGSFKTSYSIGTSAFGRAPWARSAGVEAMECAWRWGRRYVGSQDWSPADDVSWYGVPLSELSFPDHIFGKNGAGSAACRFRTDIEQRQGGQNNAYFMGSPVGVRYRATPPLISWDGEGHDAALWGSFTRGDVIWDVYGGSLIVDFDAMRATIGASGWGGAWVGPQWDGSFGDEGYRPLYMPDAFNGDSLTSPTAEWESEDPAQLINVEWSLDEYVTGPDNARVYPWDKRVGPGSVAEWFVSKVQPAEMVEGYTTTDWNQPGPHPYGTWGPWGNDEWWLKAAGDGPNEFRGSAEHIATTSSNQGGTWTPLDPTYWAHANDRVVDYSEESGDYWNNFFLKNRPAVPAQARFSILPRVMFSDNMPFTPPSGYGGDTEAGDPNPGITMEDWITGQAIALRVTVKPKRYRIHWPARIPNITYAGGPLLNVAPDDAGRVLY